MEDTFTTPDTIQNAAPLTIAGLRRELGLTQQDFAELIGLSSKGNVSILERGGAVSLPVALRLEELSGGRIDAAALNADVAAAREGLARGAAQDWALTDAEADVIAAPERIIVCDVCDRRVDGKIPKACTFVDCPHSAGVALGEAA